MKIEVLYERNVDSSIYEDNFFDPQTSEFKIIDGSFIEGEKVTVEINGNRFTRRVYWDGFAKDLYITIKKYKYFLSDF